MNYLHAFDMHGTMIEGNEDVIAVILSRITENPRPLPTQEIITPMILLTKLEQTDNISRVMELLK